MRNWTIGCAALAAMASGAATASAQAPATSAMASHSAMSAMAPSHMASSAGHTTETRTDVMMIANCHKMPRDRMLKDRECQDYMKHHPDWMKGR